jgi:hypothetical protein
MATGSQWSELRQTSSDWVSQEQQQQPIKPSGACRHQVKQLCLQPDGGSASEGYCRLYTQQPALHSSWFLPSGSCVELLLLGCSVGVRTVLVGQTVGGTARARASPCTVASLVALLTACNAFIDDAGCGCALRGQFNILTRPQSASTPPPVKLE